MNCTGSNWAIRGKDWVNYRVFHVLTWGKAIGALFPNAFWAPPPRRTTSTIFMFSYPRFCLIYPFCVGTPSIGLWYRVKRLYKRQLSVPLVSNDEVLSEMGEVFDGDGDGLAEVCRGHAQAMKMVRHKLTDGIWYCTFGLSNVVPHPTPPDFLERIWLYP